MVLVCWQLLLTEGEYSQYISYCVRAIRHTKSHGKELFPSKFIAVLFIIYNLQ